MNKSLEIQVIQKFFQKAKQERYVGFISSEKKRKKFTQNLSHLKDLNWNLLQEVNSFPPTLIRNSFTSCYVISEDASVDGTIVSADGINSLTNTGQASILVFGEAEQIYYEGEPPFNRYISI